MRKRFSAGILLAVLMLLSGCVGSRDRTVYAVEGTVERTYPGEPRIQIAHEAIPGYMEAMSMEFDTKEAGALSWLNAGDRVRFDLVITPEDGWIENIRRLSAGERPREPLLAKPALWTPPLKVGERIPNAVFTNELNQPVNLADYRGRALAITFIFTRCPFPDYCPRMSRQFARVQESLLQIPNAPTNWHLFSVSFDPEFDQPGVLMDYSSNLKPAGRRWNFLTGAPGEVKEFCGRFGVYFMRDRGTIDHNLMTAVVDTQGRVQRLFPGNKWDPDELIDELASASALSQPKDLAIK